MAQKSWPWDTGGGTGGPGDGAAGLSETVARQFLAHLHAQDLAAEGVFKGVLGELAPSGSASPITIQPGAAICYGLYISDDVETLAVATPSVGTTGGRVVLQTNWAGVGGAPLEARTRLAVKMSADGSAAIPALTQSAGTTWEISLATFTITTGGVISLSDTRTFRRSTAVVNTAELVNAAVTAAKLASDAVETAKILNGAVTAAKLASNAVETVKILNAAVTAAKLASNAVETAKINAFAVNDTKLGNRAPALTRRRGGSSSNWSTSGSTVYTPDGILIQVGASSTNASGNASVSFPVAFSVTPIVFLQPVFEGSIGAMHVENTISITSFSVTGDLLNNTFWWLAIGERLLI